MREEVKKDIIEMVAKTELPVGLEDLVGPLTKQLTKSTWLQRAKFFEVIAKTYALISQKECLVDDEVSKAEFRKEQIELALSYIKEDIDLGFEVIKNERN